MTARPTRSGHSDDGWMARLSAAVFAVLLLVTAASGGIGQTKGQATSALPESDSRFGRSVFELQVMLDRARFSPGIIDGRWGQNTESALYYLLRREGFLAKGASRSDVELSDKAFNRLVELAGGKRSPVRRHTLDEEDVSGPFVTIPEDVYAQEKMDCLCYESREEKLAELFHTSPEVLRRLNDGVALGDLEAGDEITVPNVEKIVPGRTNGSSGGPEIAKIEISDEQHYVQAHDAEGRVVYHFPSTLGSTFNPSPKGEYSVTTIAFDPAWHYQPELLGDTQRTEDAMVPKGPNNPVGLVWIDLSKEHYGIHGTNAPETIGYAVSHGCIRLTNWDALFLARRIDPGVKVDFVDLGQT